MISDDVRERLQQALEADVRNYNVDTLVVRHQALCEAIARVLSDDTQRRLLEWGDGLPRYEAPDMVDIDV